MKRYLVQTHGCQMNVHDSRRIEEVLAKEGYERTDDSQLADLIVINTCSVREKAEHKLLSLLGTMKPLKDERPGVVLAVAGCVAQQEGAKLLGRVPHVDIVLGPDNIAELPGLVSHVEREKTSIARTVFDVHDPRFLDAGAELSRRDREVSSFVTVMKGCDERCTFCIVPTTRGPERYRASSDVIREVRALVEGGVREVTLLGQTVNSWHEPGALADDDSDDELGNPRNLGESQFARLLREIAREVPGLARLRYTSPHPRHVTDALVRAHAELEVLPAHVHLPVQSGSNRVLRRMSRRYTREHYVARARALLASRPRFTLSTDFIVGFPGETEDDFRETLSLVEEVGFSAAFCFKYSQRPGTPALRLADDVSEADKDARLARLFAAVETSQRQNLASLVGTRTKVLIEDLGREGDDGIARWKGRSERHEIVHVEAPPELDLRGQLLEAAIVHANAHSLMGRVEGDLSALPRRDEPAARSSGVEPRTEHGRRRLPVTKSA
ncbi:MAG: tRNA (N6-isopentenyl adenosine(37)-C2)-methylthiotransferase MiaB [Sandaracinus sp.]